MARKKWNCRSCSTSTRRNAADEGGNSVFLFDLKVAHPSLQVYHSSHCICYSQRLTVQRKDGALTRSTFCTFTRGGKRRSTFAEGKDEGQESMDRAGLVSPLFHTHTLSGNKPVPEPLSSPTFMCMWTSRLSSCRQNGSERGSSDFDVESCANPSALAKLPADIHATV